MTNEELYYLPASELLKHIQAEKERLIKEKIIKKSKELPPITEEEKPYELPTEWEWVRLGDVIKLADNLNIQTKLNPEDMIHYLDIDSIDNSNQTVKESKFEPVKNLSTRARRVLKKDMIVYSMVRPYLKNMAIITEDKENYIGSTGFVAFEPIWVRKEYIFNFLRSDYVTNILNSFIVGFNSPSINMDQFNELHFPLPPLYIQDQIVQKLEQLSETKQSLLSHAESQLNYTKKMREALLQEAIRGELVPQDENDEPASILLEKIKTEKERLIKEKVIKKQKELPPITEDEKPYDLPSGWEWVRLGEYFDVIMGSSPKGNTVGDDLDGIEFHQGKVYFTDKFLKKSTQKTTQPTKLAIPNDVLLSVRAPVGTVNITQREICIGRGLCAIRPYLSDISYQFIYYVLSALKEEFIKQATGTTFIAITADVIRNQLIPLPPLAEQKRIVDKLDELMANCNQLEVKAEEMKNYTSKLFEASLKEAFMPE